MNRHNSPKKRPEICSVSSGEDPCWLFLHLEGGEGAELFSLVLSAMDIEHITTPRGLLVRPRDLQRARKHLEAFREENRNWPPPAGATEPFSVLRPPTLLMLAALALFHRVTGPWQGNNPWFEAGAVNSDLILNHHQWWRLVTGLTLHADLQHLLANCLVGGLMVHLLCRSIGYGTAWLTLVLAGSAGNLLNIIVRSQLHLSVGFSTSVFVAIGMFSGLSLSSLKPGVSSLSRLILPLGAGLALLAFLGSEGRQTDLGAHLAGFFCGLPAGWIFRLLHLDRWRDRAGIQLFLMLLALLPVILCWALAMGSPSLTG